ncbi:MAG: hypothetical protein HRU20_23575 [Pseudomonadales bacterium]|nr:hypothetical protein [Pseudomonadales bacterium]
MSNFHIQQLKSVLNAEHWEITTAAGNNYDIAENWLLNKGPQNCQLVFDGLAENAVLPIEQAPA